MRVTWALWSLCLLLTPVALWLEELTAPEGGGTGPLRLSAAIAFLWSVLAWLWPRRPARGRVRTVTLATILAVHLLAGVALGSDWRAAAQAAVATVVLVVVTLVLYRWRIGDDNLVPHRPGDLVLLAAASILGAVAAVPWGPAPGVGVAGEAFEVVWWVVPSAVYVFVGGATVLLLVQRAPRSEALPTPLGLVALELAVTAGCLALVFALDEQPLTWLVLLPAIWGGLSLGPWAAAAYSLAVSCTVLLVRELAIARSVDVLDRGETLQVDSLMASFVFIVLLLSLLRDQRAYLADEVVRRRQEALDQAGLLSTVFESITEALVLVDTEGVPQLHNAAAARLFGDDKLTTEPLLWLRRLPERPSFAYTFRRDDTDESPRVLAVQLAPVQYAGSDSIVAIVRDVTAERHRIEELASFAAVAAHDLKGPLVAVQGWIELARETLDSDPATSLLALARGRSATDRMAREIEDWLTYNVAREGVVHPEPIELEPFLEPIVAGYPDAQFQISTPHAVRVDRTLLRHLLMNLVGNAVKYTRPGETPCVTLRSEADPGGGVRLLVTDTGVGIPPGEEAAIFEPFHRAPTVRADFQGSGLGLALCKRIVRRHGGHISARRNDDGPGTTLVVTLPGA